MLLGQLKRKLFSFLEPANVRKSRKAGVEFHRIWLADCEQTGRSAFGSTKQEASRLVGEGAKLTRAWEAYYTRFPDIIAFGRTKSECADRLLEFMKHVTDAG